MTVKHKIYDKLGFYTFWAGPTMFDSFYPAEEPGLSSLNLSNWLSYSRPALSAI
jgi:hypothetical protein